MKSRRWRYGDSPQGAVISLPCPLRDKAAQRLVGSDVLPSENGVDDYAP